MGTTPNYNIPYPEITDFVSDGATAMEAIADKVDDILFAGSSSGNLLINGAMQVSQRSAVGTAVTGITFTGYYTADRWLSQIGALGTWTQTNIVDAPTGSGFRNSLKMQCTTADASPAAGDFCTVTQKIEGQNLQAIRKGTASAKTLTLSFWVKAFQTGTFIVELRDEDNNRCVAKSYSITASDTWQYVSIEFPADITGAFDNDANASLTVNWWLAAGASYTSGTLQTTWAASVDANRAVGVSNLASSVSNYWQMTGAQLTVGSVDVPFQFKSFAEELADCQRYYMKWTASNGAGRLGLGSAVTTGTCNFHLPYKVQPRKTLGTFSVGGSLGMSDGIGAPFTIFVLSRLDIICSDVFYGVNGTSSGMTQFRPMYLEAVSLSTGAFVASDMEL